MAGIGTGISPGLAAAGFGVTSLVGTPEEQRANELKLLLHGQNLAFEREKLAESVRQHNLQYQEVDETPLVNLARERAGLSPLPPGTVKIPQHARSGLHNAVVASMLQDKQPTTMDLSTIAPAAMSLLEKPELTREEPASITEPAPGKQADYTNLVQSGMPSEEAALSTGSPTGTRTVRDTAGEAKRAAALKNVPISAVGPISTLVERVLQNRKPTAPTHFPAGSMVADPNSPGGYRQVGEPPEKPEKKMDEFKEYRDAIAVPEDQRTAENKATIAAFEKLHPGEDPNVAKLRKLHIQEAEAKAEQRKMVQEAGNIVDQIKAGKNVPAKEVRLHLATLRPLYQQYQKEAVDDTQDEETRIFALREAKSIRETIKTLTDYLEGTPAQKGKKGETKEDVMGRLGIAGSK